MKDLIDLFEIFDNYSLRFLEIYVHMMSRDIDVNISLYYFGIT